MENKRLRENVLAILDVVMERQTLRELRALAKMRRIRYYYRMTKAELIEALKRTKELTEGMLPVTEEKLNEWLDSLEGMPALLKPEFIDWAENNLLIRKRPIPEMCTHGTVKYFWKLCVGSQICPHNKQKAYCVPCGGSQICKHKKRKELCRECRKPKTK